MWKYLLQHPHIETVANPRVLSQQEIAKWIHTSELEGSYSTIKYQHSHICIALVASLSHSENHARVAFIYLVS
jgi:hypothetical protein